MESEKSPVRDTENGTISGSVTAWELSHWMQVSFCEGSYQNLNYFIFVSCFGLLGGCGAARTQNVSGCDYIVHFAELALGGGVSLLHIVERSSSD